MIAEKYTLQFGNIYEVVSVFVLRLLFNPWYAIFFHCSPFLVGV